MSTYRYNRPVTAALVLTGPLWAPFVILWHGLKTVFGDIIPTLHKEAKQALAWSVGEPVGVGVRNVRSATLLGLWLSMGAVVAARRSVVEFYFAQVAYRIGAVLQVPAVLLMALTRIVEGDVDYLATDVRYDFQGIVNALRTGSY